MIWWTSQPSRARSERQDIAELEERVPWLRDVSWRFATEARLAADLDIVHLGETHGLTITYPSFFPAMPPQVTPRDGTRLSGHQYASGGELCLEFRPDNWEPDMTGAMIIESAYRLLSGEHPAPDETADVASAHRQTLGQESRHESMRIVMPHEVSKVLAAMPDHCVVEFAMEEHYYAKHWLAHPVRLGPADAPLWTGTTGLPNPRKRDGFAIRLADDLDVPFAATCAFVEMLLKMLKAEAGLERLRQSDFEMPILLAHRDGVRLFSVAQGEGTRFVFEYHPVAAPPEENRLAQAYAQCAARSVAIIGCGSMGSKIAASLTRAGVGEFVLVDGDLLFAGNLVRNELDWRAIGLNKPDALAARLKEINPAVRCTARKLLLGGQESSASSDSALQKIGRCDLIIDATASPQIFNLCGAVAQVEQKPFLWGEIFGGGIGGLIGRSRPALDPPPHAARRQIAAWCADHGLPWTGKTTGQYELRIGDDLPPLVADDGDVSVLAAHLSRMAIDILTGPTSEFPSSAYAIGLKRDWIFAAPFDTWPIDFLHEGRWGPEVDENKDEELAKLASELFPPDETPSDGS